MGAPAGLSLRQRALAALSRREHSRSELQRKLAPHAESHEQLDTLLDALEREKWLSNRRFAESLVHRRKDRYGRQRIGLELNQHGLAPEVVEQELAALRASEFERCKVVWRKKFLAPPTDLAERARQTRFLLARGFDSQVVARVLKGLDD